MIQSIQNSFFLCLGLLYLHTILYDVQYNALLLNPSSDMQRNNLCNVMLLFYFFFFFFLIGLYRMLISDCNQSTHQGGGTMLTISDCYLINVVNICCIQNSKYSFCWVNHDRPHHNITITIINALCNVLSYSTNAYFQLYQ